MSKTKTNKDILISKIKLSQFNSRKHSNQEDIDKLAARITRMGFEQTRAIWVYPSDGIYRVFAGGMRLAASKQAGLTTIPAIVFDGYSKEEISRLSDIDNENDEYHRPVPITDIWAEYARLNKEEGWTQEKIAEVKEVNRTIVGARIRLNRLPDKIKKYVTQNILTETHLRKILPMRMGTHFSPWLTTENLMVEMVEKIVYSIKKDGKKSVSAVEKDVAVWTKWQGYAEQVYTDFSEEMVLHDMFVDPPEPFIYYPRKAFVDELARRKARSLSAVRESELSIKRHISESLRKYHIYAKLQSTEAALVQERTERIMDILSCYKYGDARVLTDTLEDESIDLLLTDPPYGIDYRSNRRWATKAPEKIEGDGTQEEASDLLADVLSKSIAKLKQDAHVLVFCSWRGEPWVRDVMEKTGLVVKSSIIWEKEGHSAGDVKRSFAPCHERIVHAIKGSPVVKPRIRDVIKIPRAARKLHPFEKPVDLLTTLINSTTEEGSLVFDPFAGSASTCKAAHGLNRLFIAYEIDDAHYAVGKESLLKLLDTEGG